MKTRYIKANGYHVPIEWAERETSLFRLCVAWMAAVSGMVLFVGAAVWWLAR